MDIHSLKSKTLEMKDDIVAWRRDFHKYPELGYQENRTSEIIAQKMVDWGYQVQRGVGGTGIVALMEGKKPGPMLMLRFDMDALPIQEQTRAPYASILPGVMHACGHDGHLAIGLTVACLLALNKNLIRGGLKFVFQPAEETLGGAKRMMDEGILENPRPDFCLAAHLWNEKSVGWIGISSGPMMAGADTLEIIISGKGGHGALPNQTRDPVVASAQIISALQTIVARNIDPRASAVISITQVLAGDAFNIIPEKALLRGTIRTFDPGIRQLIHKRIESIASEIAAAFECEAATKITRVAPPVVNEERLTEIAGDVARRLFPQGHIDTEVMCMVSEDMAYVMEAIPGCYILIGSNDPQRGLDAPHHSPYFDFDEEALTNGAAILSATAWTILETL